MTLNWAYIASVLVREAPIYKLCPGQGAHLTWVISWCLSTQAEGWGRLRWGGWTALDRLPRGGTHWRSWTASHRQRQVGSWDHRKPPPSHRVLI